ncbi:jerky protein [Danaus plexippus plexippus]|uniref:Jerky protein n=1 Tax=Danaus plexippus plexippus TaxID=278856 RepID=A0A212F7V7_DANPL|nr:jerky protein [Danaus plexippus plexippus]
MERKTLKKAWNKSLNREIKISVTNTDDSTLEEINELRLKIQICKDCDDDMKEWATCDSYDQGFQIMSDDEIVESIMQRNEQHEMQEDKTEENDAGPSHDDALYALETALQWFEKQTGSDTEEVMRSARRVEVAIPALKTLPASSLGAEVDKALEAILGVARKSGNLKGGCNRALKSSTQLLKDATEVLLKRSSSEENELLRARFREEQEKNSLLQIELQALVIIL